MAPAMATKRLRKELIKLQTEPPPGIIAEPDESNILKWHYVIRGPTETPYEGGVYLGKIVFPSEYPMKAPSIYMLTPSGRFQISTKICMSMSDFHPESWNPMWSVATIIQGIQSFMASEELTTGGLKASEVDRKKFAKLSMAYNNKNYPNLFHGDIQAALEAADQACQKCEKENAKTSSSGRNDKAAPSSRRSRRMARKAASTEGEKPCEDDETGRTKDDEDKDEKNNISTATTTKELTPEDIEKRRKKNAKKRAKQKAKKAASATREDCAESTNGEEQY
mmetsp:Transcript_26236/g.72032  ORF Transcript_26236/g.72032 Transcript_26236/m.72032 type:complete len:280 (-) Transcript_26236:655-1494(-)|eukprot:CAMPEP_0172372580 /NCGR_PEP_ID=MMETSP1060-20121228/48313_1 /TAXON_ID=37318 /ORGANISM="Pseudo-nitzschia pungens, Strain cf. cingulata" /LENGTH=279 /DNA_ID=CAMNT_0013098645 /DNA_START=266 /DNA_END=1105 /DNA_ORIENTATION=-